MSNQSAKEVIEQAIARVQRDVPALEQLKLIVGVELRGRGDVQLYRVELPGPKVTKDGAPDARVRLSMNRSELNELARKGTLRDWRAAFESGHAEASGSEQIIKLIENVVDRQEQRDRTPKTHR